MIPNAETIGNMKILTVKRKLLRNCFTLPELLVSMGVFAVLLVAMMEIFSGVQKTYRLAEQKNALYSGANLALDAADRIIGAADASSVEIVDASGDCSCVCVSVTDFFDDGKEKLYKVTFRYNSGAHTIEMTRQKLVGEADLDWSPVDGSGIDILAWHVVDCRFEKCLNGRYVKMEIKLLPEQAYDEWIAETDGTEQSRIADENAVIFMRLIEIENRYQ